MTTSTITSMTRLVKRSVHALSISTLMFATSIAHAKVYHVYYLGGQSNMDGYGTVDELPKDLRQPVDGCMIFHGNNQNFGESPLGLGVWATLTPGHGTQFSTDGKSNTLSERFGPELTFGRTMQERFPDRNIAIVKFSRGGSSLAQIPRRPCWDPHDQRILNGNVGMNQYDFALKTIDNALRVRDIDGDGEDDTLIPAGIIWMQGETDGTARSAANRYESNLAELMELFRASLRMDGLPVVIGLISESKARVEAGNGRPFGQVVRNAQQAFCDSDPNAELVTTTDQYGYSDPYHFDSEGYIDLGIQFARAMHRLETADGDE